MCPCLPPSTPSLLASPPSPSLPSPPLPSSPPLLQPQYVPEAFNDFCSQVAGFFIVEDRIMRTAGSLVSPSQVRLLSEESSHTGPWWGYCVSLSGNEAYWQPGVAQPGTGGLKHAA